MPILGPAIILGVVGLLGLASASKKKDSTLLPPSKGGSGTGSPPSSSSSSDTANAALSGALATMTLQAIRDMGFNDQGVLVSQPTAESIQRATAVARQLDDAGFHTAASQLRDVFIAQAAAKVPPATPKVQVPTSVIPSALQDQINRAIQINRDPVVLRGLASQLRALPNQTPETVALANSLEATAAQIQAAQDASRTIAQVDEVIKSPGIPQVTPGGAPPRVIEVPGITITPGPVARTSQQMLADRVQTNMLTLEKASGGKPKVYRDKVDKSAVLAFQAQEKLGSDGKAGPGFMLALAKYVSEIPLVLYWPNSANSKTVHQYQANLNALADQRAAEGNLSGATELRASALKERGQAGIADPNNV